LKSWLNPVLVEREASLHDIEKVLADVKWSYECNFVFATDQLLNTVCDKFVDNEIGYLLAENTDLRQTPVIYMVVKKVGHFDFKRGILTSVDQNKREARKSWHNFSDLMREKARNFDSCNIRNVKPIAIPSGTGYTHSGTSSQDRKAGKPVWKGRKNRGDRGRGGLGAPSVGGALNTTRGDGPEFPEMVSMLNPRRLTGITGWTVQRLMQTIKIWYARTATRLVICSSRSVSIGLRVRERHLIRNCPRTTSRAEQDRLISEDQKKRGLRCLQRKEDKEKKRRLQHVKQVGTRQKNLEQETFVAKNLRYDFSCRAFS
jgi:hypothetical protein